MLKETAADGGRSIKDVVMQLLRKAGALGKRILTSLNPLTRYSLPLPISLWIIANLSARLHQGGEICTQDFIIVKQSTLNLSVGTLLFHRKHKVHRGQPTATLCFSLAPFPPPSGAFVVSGLLRHQLNQVDREFFSGSLRWPRG